MSTVAKTSALDGFDVYYKNVSAEVQKSRQTGRFWCAAAVASVSILVAQLAIHFFEQLATTFASIAFAMPYITIAAATLAYISLWKASRSYLEKIEQPVITTSPVPTSPISTSPNPTSPISASPISTSPTPTNPISASPINRLIQHIEKIPAALQVVGLFRTEVSKPKKDELYAAFKENPQTTPLPSLLLEDGTIDSDAVHLVIGVMKQWFRDLNIFGSEEKLSKKFYKGLKKVKENGGDPLVLLKNLIDDLTPEKRGELKTFLTFVSEVEKNKNDNKMTFENLANILSPSLNTNPHKKALDFVKTINTVGLVLFKSYHELKF